MPARRPPPVFSSPSPCIVDSSLMYPLSGLPVIPPRGKQLWSFVICVISFIVLVFVGVTAGLRQSDVMLDHIVVSNTKNIPDALHLSSRIFARSSKFDLRRSTNDGLGLPVEVTNNWAAYTPWEPAGNYTTPPQGCAITQVNLIQRHGARFPTSGAAERIVSSIGKLQNATQYLDTKFDFLKDFEYDLGTADLIPFGASQSFEAGKEAWERYSELVKSGGEAPFVRASSSQRVVDTATNWTAGFGNVSLASFAPTLSVVLSEDSNDTLENGMCTNAGDSDDQTAEWLSVYGPSITARLNEKAPGANLTNDDIYSLMSMCAFHTLVSESKSPFCDLFEEKEWTAYEYWGDLDKFYGNGYDQDLGPVQGVGYVNELIARLTNSPVQDHTQTNATLDSSSVTFPLNQTFYADFSHDNEIISIFTAIGIFKQYQLANQTLDPTTPDAKRTWITSKLVPFSGRMVVERLQCNSNVGEAHANTGTYVRLLVNDAVQPLEFCGGVEGVGLCELDDFVESQAYSRQNGEGDWEKCFA